MFGKYYFVCLANTILYVWQILFCMFGKYYFSFFVHLSNINQYHWAYLVNSMFYTWQEEFKHLKVRFKGTCLWVGQCQFFSQKGRRPCSGPTCTGEDSTRPKALNSKRICKQLVLALPLCLSHRLLHNWILGNTLCRATDIAQVTFLKKERKIG